MLCPGEHSGRKEGVEGVVGDGKKRPKRTLWMKAPGFKGEQKVT